MDSSPDPDPDTELTESTDAPTESTDAPVPVAASATGPLAVQLADLFEQLESTLEAVHALDKDGWIDEDRLWAIAGSARAAAMLDAARCVLVRHADAVDAAAAEGLGTTQSWLRQAAQMAGRTAAREVKRARVLRFLPLAAAAFAAGEISADQVDAFVRVHNPRTAEAMSRDEELLLDVCRYSTADRFAAEMRGWAEMVDTDGIEPDPGHRDRGFSIAQGFDGRWNGSFTLGSSDGAAVAAAVDRVAERFRREDQRNGVSRTASQRRADAFSALVLGGVATSVTFNVVVRADDLAEGVFGSRLAADATSATVGGTYLSPADTLRMAADASIRAVVVDPASGAVLRFGRSRRLASTAQKVALSIEADGCCGFVGCTNTIDDAHHVQEWDDGGLTDVDNMVGLCQFHHDLVHDHGWSVVKARDGTLSWRRPDGRTMDASPGWARRHAPPSQELHEADLARERARRLGQQRQLHQAA